MKSTHSFTFFSYFSYAPALYYEKSSSFSYYSLSTICTISPAFPTCCLSLSSSIRPSACTWKGSIANSLIPLPLGEQQRSITYDCPQRPVKALYIYFCMFFIAVIWLIVGWVPKQEGSFWHSPTSCPSSTYTLNWSVPSSSRDQCLRRMSQHPLYSSATASVRYYDILTIMTSCERVLSFRSSFEQSLGVRWASFTKTAPPSALIPAYIDDCWWKWLRLGLVSSLSRNQMDWGERSIKTLSMRYSYGIRLHHSLQEKREDVGCAFYIDYVKEIQCHESTYGIIGKIR